MNTHDTLSVIFGYIDIPDLVAAARVCRLWRTVAYEERQRRSKHLAKIATTCIAQNKDHLILAGSMALWIKEKHPATWFPNDADIFAYGTPKVPTERFGTHVAERTVLCENKTYSYLAATNQEGSAAPRPRIINHKTKYGNIQLVLSSMFKTPQDVIESFDISCTMVGITAPNTIITSKHFAADFTAFYYKKPTHTFEEHVLAEYQKSRTYNRAQKYITRGYTHKNDKPASKNQMTFAMLYALSNCETLKSILESGKPITCSCIHKKKKCHFTALITGRDLF